MVENILNNKTNLLLTIVLLVLIVFNLSLLNYKIISPTMANNEIKKQYEERQAQKEQEKQESEIQNDTVTKEEAEQTYVNNLKSMGEAERMKSYLYSYISLIMYEKYEEAFGKLYGEFKEQYFNNNLENYTSYIKNRYPDFMAVEYNDIERQGEYYILTVIIRNAIPEENTTALKQKFIMNEKGINDYELSFQVI